MRVIDERLGRAKEGHFYERKVIFYGAIQMRAILQKLVLKPGLSGLLNILHPVLVCIC